MPNPGQPGFDDSAPKCYVLEMLPYPSGDPHVGHLKNYAIGDAIAHYRRRNGFQVVHPMGFDAFGLPAENNAIKTGEPPRVATERSIEAYKRAFRPPGLLVRLGTRALIARAVVLPLDPMDLPEAPRAWLGVPGRGPGPVVPCRPDRARQRAGHRRALRALRQPRRGPPARAVVLPHHGLRRPASGRPRHHRLAGAREDDAAELDRSFVRRRGDLPMRGARHRLPRLHDPAGHPLRRDVLRPRPRAPGHRAPGCRHRARGRHPRVRERGDPQSRPRSAARRSARRQASRSAARSRTR